MHSKDAGTGRDLAAIVREQAAAIDELRQEVAELRGPKCAPAVEADAEAPTTRRRLLIGAGGLAAGVTALAAAPERSAAANGDPLVLGNFGNTASAPTKLTSSFSGDGLWIEKTAATSYSTVLAATASSEAIGVYGRTGGFSSVPLQNAGVLGVSSHLAGVAGHSNTNVGVAGITASGPAGVSGHTDGSGAGVRGTSGSGDGVTGSTAGPGAGVRGTHTGSGSAVRGDVPAGAAATAVEAVTAGAGNALRADATDIRSGSPAARIAHAGSGQAIVAISGKGVGGKFTGKSAAIQLTPQSATGAPATGSHAKGELLVDAAGDMFLCVANGTPGTWRQVQLA